MKKLLVMILCAAMILSLAACGAQSSSSADSAAAGVSQVENAPAAGDKAPETQAEKSEAPAADSQSSAPADGAVQALEEKYAGLSEDKLTWEYNSSTNTVMISGEGPMRDYLDAAPEWDQYSGEAKRVVIGDKVTSVGGGAFWWFSEITEVELGESVEYIGTLAFSNCYALEKVNFPEKLQYVGESAFSNALLHSDKGFVFPEGMLYAGKGSFYSALKESFVSIPASLSNIGDDAFGNCYVEEFRVDPANPAFAAENGILYDKGLTTLINYPAMKKDKTFEIPETVTTILKDAIAVTNDLEKIVIPASVSKVEEASIYWNYGLSRIDVAEGNQNYKSEDGVLYTADGKLLISYPGASDRTEYTVLEGCERLGSHSMSQAANLAELHVKEGLKEIGDFALYFCGKLAQIGLPKSLEKVETDAFNACDALTRINYAGSSAGWSLIEISEHNDRLTDGSAQIFPAE